MPVDVGDENPFLQRIEDLLEKSFLLHKPNQRILDLLRFQLANARDEFVEKTWFHNTTVTNLDAYNKIFQSN